MRLWIDDEREPIGDWVWAKSYDEAIGYFEDEIVSEASLDHDLGLLRYPQDNDLLIVPSAEPHNERSGYTVVLWMVSNDHWPAALSVHSMNPVGAGNICGVIERYGPYVYKQHILCADRYNGALSAVRYTRT